MRRPRLLLADDHELLLDGLRRVLEPEFDLVGSATDGRTAISEYERLSPDLILLDIGLPLLNGIEVARHLKRVAQNPRIVFVTMHTDRIYVEEAFAAGASGFVLKQSAARELVDAIKTVLAGGTFISPHIANTSAMAATALGQPGPRPLTPRQREVLQLIAEGKSMKQIADILEISIRTVEFHKISLAQQLGIHSTAELTRYALEHRIAPR